MHIEFGSGSYTYLTCCIKKFFISMFEAVKKIPSLFYRSIGKLFIQKINNLIALRIKARSGKISWT